MKRPSPKPLKPIFDEEFEQEIDRQIQDPQLRRIFKANLDDREEIERYNRARQKDWLLFWLMIGLCLLMLVLSEVIL